MATMIADRMVSAAKQEKARAWPTRRMSGPAMKQPSNPPPATAVTAEPATHGSYPAFASVNGT